MSLDSALEQLRASQERLRMAQEAAGEQPMAEETGGLGRVLGRAAVFGKRVVTGLHSGYVTQQNESFDELAALKIRAQTASNELARKRVELRKTLGR